MVREIENAAGIPVVQIATIIPIMLTVGANRIIPGVAIPHPVGDPSRGKEGDRLVRRAILERAIRAMQIPVTEQTIFTS
ncbi:MAG: hypothetical protein STSR0007_10300 [Thermovirga sp.]